MKLVFPLFFFCVSLVALPQKGTFVEGNGKIITAGRSMTVATEAKRAIIDWETFGIGEGESVTITQPSTKGACLNRAVGLQGSFLNGTLLSNATVFLINQYGIIIGPTGKIEANTFLASTLDVKNEEFLTDKEMCFVGKTDQGVSNFGHINTLDGDVVFLGSNVSNEGPIKATGVVAIGAGRQIIYKPYDADRIYIVGEKGKPNGLGLDIDQKIEASQIIFKADGNLYSLAINVIGTLEVTGSKEIDGRILLESETGTVKLNGSAELTYRSDVKKEGTINLFGKHVELEDSVAVSTTCHSFAGNINIGGRVNGKNYTIKNAATTKIGEFVKIDASAIEQGNGGNVVVYSEDKTIYAGSIHAQGGKYQGNGGQVEVSGKKDLVFRGQINTKAHHGKNGNLVIDPNTLTLSRKQAPESINQVSVNTLYVEDLQNCLETANVTLKTSGEASGTGDLLIDANISLKSPGNGLTFYAYRDIVVGKHFSFKNTGQPGAKAIFFARRNIKMHK